MKKTSLKKIGSEKKTVWVTRPNLNEDHLLKKRRESAYKSISKVFDEKKDFETVMQMAENFGNTIFKEFVKEKPQKWTMKNWVEPVVKNVFNPMGAAATFTKITDDEARSLIFRCPAPEHFDTSGMPSCLFSYGFTRGLLLSAFPEGELVMDKTMSDGFPMCEFVFKAKASDSDKKEKERIKKHFVKYESKMIK
ncbi:hypothetical protein MBGDN05_00604 [Thermoplasmatales archaeon SCGC AB-539-N05]|nr:hypothetical protein MBGDN05_00604 [Thermoplasmatales archaeon SCGC AB-539-N05]